jgi:hypothetical protein
MTREIFVIPYGGLGNQLFQLAAALDLAKEGKVYVLGKWGFARKCENGLIDIDNLNLPSKVKIEYGSEPSVFAKRLSNFLLRQGSTRRNRNLTIKILEKIVKPFYVWKLSKFVSISIANGLGLSKVDTKDKVLILGYFQNSAWPKNVLEQMISIAPKNLTPKAKNLILEIQRQHATAVHVRRGDYLKENFGVLESSYYHEALKKLNTRRDTPLWIFSDDQEISRRLSVFDEYSNVYFVEDSGLESFETMEIMRHAKNFVIANSSFSWWGAHLRYNQQGKVVAPWPWFKTPNSPSEILSEDWLKIEW